MAGDNHCRFDVTMTHLRCALVLCLVLGSGDSSETITPKLPAARRTSPLAGVLLTPGVSGMDLVNTTQKAIRVPEAAAQERLAASKHHCPAGFLKHRGSCYHVSAPTDLRRAAEGRHNYTTARDHCHSLGSQLVSIESESEQMFLEKMLARSSSKAFWTSGRANAAKAQWKWEGTGQEASYVNWLADYSSWPYEAVHDSDNCLVIDASSNYQWMFWPCGHSYYVVGTRRTTRVAIEVVCELSSKPSGWPMRRKAKVKHKSDMANR